MRGRAGLGTVLAVAAVLALAACADDQDPSPGPTGVDDGAVVITPSPAPSGSIPPTGWPPPPTPVPRTTDSDYVITDAIALYLAQSVVEYVGWCDEVGPDITSGGFCADRPRPTEGVVAVRIGPVGSEYTQELLVGPRVEGDGWVVIGDTPIEYQGERTTDVE